MIDKKEYIIASLPQLMATPENIISHSLDEEILDRMNRVIEIEAPIREQLLFKRVINSLGLQKIGSRILPVFSGISKRIEFEKTEEKGEIVYHSGNEDFFRPTPDSAIRYSYQIPYSEGANCILYILENNEANSWSKTSLKKRFTQELEYLKCGAKVDELFKYSLKDSRIKISGNGRVLK